MGRLRIGRARLFFTVALMALFTLLITTTTTTSAQTTADIIAKKVSKLQAKATKTKGVIELDSLAFDDVLAKPRNYSMVVLFTAISPEFQCVPCKYVSSLILLYAFGNYCCQNSTRQEKKHVNEIDKGLHGTTHAITL